MSEAAPKAMLEVWHCLSRRWLHALCAVILTIIGLTGMSTDAHAIPLRQDSDSASRNARWIEDVQYLAEQLPARHVDPFFSITREAFESSVAALVADIPTLTDAQVVVRISEIVASIGDGHTQIYLFNAGYFHVFPMSLYWFGDDLVVTSILPDYQRALRAHVLKIGDTDIADALAAVMPVIPADNAQQIKGNSPLYLRIPEILNAVGVLPDVGSTTFTFAQDDGEPFTLDIAPVLEIAPYRSVSLFDGLNTQPPLAFRNQAANYSYFYFDDNHTLYFQYNRAVEDPQIPFADFNRDMFAFIDSHPVDRLVLDLRFNGGGNSAILDPFFEALLARPELNTRGRLVTLIGRATFSSAVLNAIRMKTQTNSLLVGEPTGGRPNHYGEIQTFVLPNSGLQVQYSTKYFRDWADSDAPSLPPDIPVEMTLNDLLAGRDPVLEAALTAAPDS